MRIKLKTKEGEPIHETTIPPYNTPPQIIVWGTRHFQLNIANGNPPTQAIYHEAFTHFLPS